MPERGPSSRHNTTAVMYTVYLNKKKAMDNVEGADYAVRLPRFMTS
jgi:hypothetical protein